MTAVNKDWLDRWGDCVKTDYDFDSDFLIKVVVNKLKLMQEYFIKSKSQSEDEYNKIISEIAECIYYGDRVLNNNYSKDVDELEAEYGLKYLYDKDVFDKWYKLVEQAGKDRSSDITTFFSKLAEYTNNWSWV